MGVNTIVKDGVIEKFNYPVEVWDLDEDQWHHNPSIARDKTGKIWCATRHHLEKPVIRYANIIAPYSHPPSWLMLSILDEKTLKVSGVKRIKPEKDSPNYLLEKEIEDCRIFWREDGLHGIGVSINEYDYPEGTKITQIEILIDYEKGTYKLLKNYGIPRNTTEKNWSPPIVPTDDFDFIYSPTEIFKDGQIIGKEYSGITHGGSQLLPYKDGWIRIAHQVVPIRDLTHRWYVSVAELINKAGFVTHTSQFFDLCTGWRPQIKESVEFISGMVWSKDKEDEELLVSYGLRDETAAFVRIPVDMFKWSPIEEEEVVYYNWVFKDGVAPTSPDLWHGKRFTGSVEI